MFRPTGAINHHVQWCDKTKKQFCGSGLDSSAQDREQWWAVVETVVDF
jgi:hypothetical protein